jgi:hypothetical protein
MVTDLHHLLELPPDTPGPARRLAEHLGNVVRAATAGDTGAAWHSALPCRRRPGNRACPGRMTVLRTEPESPIQWECSACADAGVISNWAGSIYDLRRRNLAVVESADDLLISSEVATALRELQLLDADRERLVFRIRAHHDGAVLSANHDDLEDLVGSVAAEANHEPNRRRRQRLDAALDALDGAIAAR